MYLAPLHSLYMRYTTIKVGAQVVRIVRTLQLITAAINIPRLVFTRQEAWSPLVSLHSPTGEAMHQFKELRYALRPPL